MNQELNMTDVSFEGEQVDTLTAQLPSTKIEDLMAAYPLGTEMTLRLNVRVKSVRIDEDRKGNLVRTHVLAVDGVQMADVLTPRERARLEAGVTADGQIPGQMSVDDALGDMADEAIAELTEMATGPSST